MGWVGSEVGGGGVVMSVVGCGVGRRREMCIRERTTSARAYQSENDLIK